jgi:hypothetical protein
MGLDLYVGPLSRYYAGQWETIIQQYARQSGKEVRVVRPSPMQRSIFGGLLDRLRRSAGIDHRVAQWQKEVTRVAGVPIEWDDRADRDYFTDKPAWDCYGALVLKAAYEDHAATRYPGTADNWSEDPILRSSLSDRDSKYTHLLNDTEVWLPAKFDRPFRSKTIAGTDAMIGSTIGLLGELRRLNESTWAASDEAISEWRRNGAEFGAPFEDSARFGFAIFYELTQLAVQHRLPMKLDY